MSRQGGLKGKGTLLVLGTTLLCAGHRPVCYWVPPSLGIGVPKLFPPSCCNITFCSQKEEQEIQRKKDKIIQMAMKRQADLERKRAEKEQAAAKAKDQKRLVYFHYDFFGVVGKRLNPSLSCFQGYRSAAVL